MKFFDYFYREELTLEGAWAHRWDVFLSAWDGSDRVRQVFSHVASAQKFWIIHPEYQIATADLPVGPRFEADGGEAASMQGLVRHLETLCDVRRARLCIDITGMLRPHIAVPLRILKHEGVRSFDAIYSRPADYKQREQTIFSSGEVDVREITGFEGINRPGVREVLIVAPGFDDALLREIVSHKGRAARYQLFGLPSLQADMYQLNILKAYGLDTPLPDDEMPDSKRFASAADPFAIATELSAIVSSVLKRKQQSRFYIAPLGTKTQMLGAALYYLAEHNNVVVSLIYPVVSSHAPGTSAGISRVSINTIDYRLLDAISVRN